MKREEIRKTTGITLIALVVTIVVLIILATISINAVLGENGIIRRAEQARQHQANAEVSDNAAMDELALHLANAMQEEEQNEPQQVTIEDLMSEASDKNEIVEDAYGNKIVIPAGFVILDHGTDNVNYTYDKENGVSTNNPVVQDGIVIKNVTDNNQFVWIPIGTLKNDAVKDTTNTTTIELGRYTDYTISEDGTMPTPIQKASKTDYDTPVAKNNGTDNFVEISSDFAGETVGEVVYSSADSYGNTKAYDLEEWIKTTLDNGGYYIARFEATKNDSDMAKNDVSDSPWRVTQITAASKARDMYSAETGTNKDKYYSELINSYAWDTAVLFISTYEDLRDYYPEPCYGTTLFYGADVICNIYNLHTGVCEWSTETCNSDSEPCTSRGGWHNYMYLSHGGGDMYTFESWDIEIYEIMDQSNFINRGFGFRPILCIK